MRCFWLVATILVAGYCGCGWGATDELPTLRFSRSLDAGGSEGYDLLCHKAQMHRPRCAVLQYRDGNLLRDREVPLATAEQLANQFLRGLPTGRVQNGVPDDAVRLPDIDSGIAWTAVGAEGFSRGSLPVSSGGSDQGEQKTLTAVLGLELRLSREIRK
jgi:hypothetical protein